MRFIEEIIHEFSDSPIRLRIKVEDDIIRKRQYGWILKDLCLNDGGFHSNYCITYKMIKYEGVD